MTNNTRRWSKEEIERNDKTEGLQIFSNFLAADEGRSRERVCILNEHHSDFEKNRLFIENAPEMFDRLVECRNLLVLTRLIDRSSQSSELLEKVEATLLKLGWKQP